MRTGAISSAIIIVLIIIVVSVLAYHRLAHKAYAINALWYNLPTGPSHGGAIVLVTGAPLPQTAVGKTVKVHITSTNAGSQEIATALSAYTGKIGALDPTGTQVTIGPAPKVFDGSWDAGVAAVGVVNVHRY